MEADGCLQDVKIYTKSKYEAGMYGRQTHNKEMTRVNSLSLGHTKIDGVNKNSGDKVLYTNRQKDVKTNSQS